MVRRSHIAAALVATLAAVIAPPLLAQASADSFAGELLAEHNAERAALGLDPLTWSDELVRDAQGWADSLARSSKLQHDKGRGEQGENLWKGTTGFFGAKDMIGGFLAEREYYRHGDAFPNVSTTGNWVDVGHYTQIVWRDTKEVGCAIASNGKDDYLVCRYMPSGNWYGKPVY